HEQRREIEKVVDPVPPPRHEPVRLTEGPAHPAIHPTRPGIQVGELPDRARRGQEEDQHREEPQQQARRSELARGGQPPETHDRRDVEEHDVPKPHDARQRRRVWRAHGCTVTAAQLTADPRTAPPSTSVGKCRAAVTRRVPTIAAAVYRRTALRVACGRWRRRAITVYAVAAAKASSAWPDGNDSRLSRIFAASGAAPVYRMGRLRWTVTFTH